MAKRRKRTKSVSVRRRRVGARRRRRNSRWTTPASLGRARKTVKNRHKKKAAVTYKKKYRIFSNPKRRRKRRKAVAHTPVIRRRRRRRNPAAVAAPVKNARRRRRIHRRRRNAPPATRKSMKRARASIRHKWKRPLAKAMQRKYRMRSNPRRRRHYRRHRNPAFASMFMQKIIPVAASLYAARFISGKVAGQIPGLDKVPDKFRSSALAGLVFVAGHFATKKVPQLRKYRDAILVGLGINLADKVLAAIAPANVTSMLGLGTFYSPQGEYVQVGATPLDDDLALSEYLQVGQYFETNNADVYQDLGVEQDLGDWSDRNLGGVSGSSMLAAAPTMNMLGPVPERSFQKQVPGVSSSFDDDAFVYTGMFAGGFGN